MPPRTNRVLTEDRLDRLLNGNWGRAVFSEVSAGQITARQLDHRPPTVLDGSRHQHQQPDNLTVQKFHNLANKYQPAGTGQYIVRYSIGLRRVQ